MRKKNINRDKDSQQEETKKWDFCKELAKRQPMRVIFRDAGFKDDAVKDNVEQIFKHVSPHTEVKCL